MLHLFDDLWLDNIISKNNDEGRAIYGNLENKINTLYWPVEKVVSKSGNPGPGPVPKTRAQIRIFFITSLLRH